jgi:hypothetical protein
MPFGIIPFCFYSLLLLLNFYQLFCFCRQRGKKLVCSITTLLCFYCAPKFTYLCQWFWQCLHQSLHVSSILDSNKYLSLIKTLTIKLINGEKLQDILCVCAKIAWYDIVIYWTYPGISGIFFCYRFLSPLFVYALVLLRVLGVSIKC